MSRTDRAGAVLEVDLAAIVANWRFLCTKHPSGPIAGVVKADAYGLGARRVASALYEAGCRHFFVALLDEALELRKCVPEAMLAVLGGLLAGCEADYLVHNIVPALGALSEIDADLRTRTSIPRKSAGSARQEKVASRAPPMPSNAEPVSSAARTVVTDSSSGTMRRG